MDGSMFPCMVLHNTSFTLSCICNTHTLMIYFNVIGVRIYVFHTSNPATSAVMSAFRNQCGS